LKKAGVAKSVTRRKTRSATKRLQAKEANLGGGDQDIYQNQKNTLLTSPDTLLTSSKVEKSEPLTVTEVYKKDEIQDVKPENVAQTGVAENPGWLKINDTGNDQIQPEVTPSEPPTPEPSSQNKPEESNKFEKNLKNVFKNIHLNLIKISIWMILFLSNFFLLKWSSHSIRLNYLPQFLFDFYSESDIPYPDPVECIITLASFITTKYLFKKVKF
jgi:hypothetical protein